jgi:uncharacterized LabA/DUF88 family protein
MQMPNKKRNNYAFIDSQNLNLGVQQGHHWKLDFGKFRIFLRDKFDVTQAYIFIGNVEGNEPLYEQLTKQGYILIFKPTLVYKREGVEIIKGNVDAELVLHTMIQWDNFDQAVIIAGDGDYHCLVEYLDIKKKLARIIIPNKRGFSALLRKYRPYFYFLNDARKKVARQEKTK